jgi:hypothetical protein
LKRTDKTRILRRQLDLKFKGKKTIGWPRTQLFSHITEDIKKAGKIWQESKRKNSGNMEEIGEFCPLNLGVCF